MKKQTAVAIISVLAVLAVICGIMYFVTYADKTDKINDLTAKVADRDSQIKTLTADVADKAGQIETLTADVADKAGRIETLDADVADKAGQIETLTADVADKAGQIETLTADVADKAGQIETLDQVRVYLRSLAYAADEGTGPVLVTLNGQNIREDSKDLLIWKDYLVPRPESELDEETRTLLNQYSLSSAIQYVAIKQNLEKKGIFITSEETESAQTEAEKQWDTAVESVMAQVYGVGAEASEEEKTAGRTNAENYLLEKYGYSRKGYIAEAELRLAYNKTSDLAAKEVILNDEDVRAYFDELVEQDKEQLRSTVLEKDESLNEDSSEEEINAAMVPYYEINKYYYGSESKYIPEGYRGITHILLKPDDELLKNWVDLKTKLGEASEDVTQEMVDAAKQAVLDSVKDTVDEIKAKLESGSSFEDLILEYGTDPGMQDEATRKSGYPVHAKGIAYDSDFTSGAMALEKVGDVSEPVVSQFGVHILQYLRDIPGGAVEFTEELKSSLYETLLQEKINTALSDMVSKWTGEAELVWTEAGESWKLPEEETAETAESSETAESPETTETAETAETPEASETTETTETTETPEASETTETTETAETPEASETAGTSETAEAAETPETTETTETAESSESVETPESTETSK